jgi:hypothetical protein
MEDKMARVIDLPFGDGADFSVDETAGVLTLEIKGTILGNQEDVQIPISLKSIFNVLLLGVTNPIAKGALTVLVNLFI